MRSSHFIAHILTIAQACSKPKFFKHLFLCLLVLLNTFVFPTEPAQAQLTTFTLVNISTSGTGTSSGSSGSFTVNGAGTGLGTVSGGGVSSAGDSFTYLYLKTSGNVEMITKVTSQQNTNNYAQGGLMIRQALTSATAQASVTVSPLNGVNFSTRPIGTNQPMDVMLGPTIAAPTWLRIVKSGNTIAGYQSADGYSNWTLIGKTSMNLPEPFYIGFAVSSNADPTLSTVQFSNSVFMRDVPQRSANMLLWLRGDAGVETAAGKVTNWVDQSDQGNSAAQPTAANQPAISANSLNGLAAVDFALSGTNRWLQLPNGFDNFNGLSIFVVAKSAGSVSSDARFIDLGQGASNDNIQLYEPGSPTGLTFRVYDGASNSTVTATGMSSSAFHLAEAIHDGNSTASLWIDGTFKSSNTSMKSIKNELRDGNFIGKAFGSNNYFEGKIAEILVFNKGMTDAERKSVESYFFFKYGLGSAPPVAPPTISVQLAGGGLRPATGVYPGTVTVQMTADPLYNVYYTTNGTTPTTGSTPYTGPFTVASSSTVQSIAVEGVSQSTVAKSRIEIDSLVSNVSTNGLNAWYRADDNFVTRSGSNVTAWSDLSGNNMDASSPGNQPTWTSSAVNSKPAIVFNGTNQYLQLPVNFSSFPQGGSMFVVAKPTSSSNNQRLFDFGNGTTTDNIQLYQTNGGAGLTYRVYIGGSQTNVNKTTGLTVNSFALMEVVQNGTTSTLYINGSNPVENTSMNAIPSIQRTGNFIGKANNSANYFEGQIAELIFYNRPVTLEERIGIEAYVVGRYAVGTAPTLPAPTILSPPSAVVTTTSVPLSITATNSASIYYNVGTNNSIPADPTTGSTPYSPGGTVQTTPGITTVKAIAAKANYANSPVSQARVSYDPASPVVADPHLKTWLTATNVVTDGSGKVSQWTDSSANGNHATQSNGANQPTWNSGVVNSLPAVTFASGSSQFMQFPSGFSDFTNGMTVFAVARLSSTSPGSGRIIDFGNGATSDNIELFHFSSDVYRLSILNGASATNLSSTGTIDKSNFHLYEAWHNGTSTAKLFTDGVENVSSTSMNAITNVTRTGNFLGKAFGSTNYFEGKIAELIIYDGALSDQKRHDIENYLMSKYNTAPITVTPPTITPSAGAWSATTPITITAPDPGSEIVYSDNGTDPPTTPYTGPFTISSSKTIKARAKIGSSSSVTTTAYIQIDNNAAHLPRESMVLWLKTDNNNDNTTVASPVALWRDVSGKGNDASQSVSGNRPTVVTNAQNSLPAVAFASGSSQWLQLATGMADFTNGVTMFVVGKPISPSADARIVDFGQGTADDNIILSLPSNTSSKFWVYDGTNVSSVTASNSVVNNQFQLLEVNHTGREAADIKWFPASPNPPSNFIGTLRNIKNDPRTGNYIGRNGSASPGNFLNGQIAEIIIYNKSLTAAEQRKVEAYLVGRYALNSLTIAPTISPGSGVFSGSQTVSITAYPGATIRYTTDGSTPTGSSPTYTGQFAANESMIVRAIAVGANTSPVTTSYIQIQPNADAVSRTGLMLWYKSEYGIELATDPSFVQSWADLSGMEYLATTDPGHEPFIRGNEPTTRDDSIGFPTVETSYIVGSLVNPRYLKIPPGLSDLEDGLTYFAIVKPTSSVLNEGHLLNLGNATNSENVEIRNNPQNESASVRIKRDPNTPDSAATGADDFPLDKLQVISVVQNGATNAKIYIDGEQQANGSVKNAHDITRLINRFGTDQAQDDKTFTGAFGEVLMYNRALSDSERSLIESYLSQKYQPQLINSVSAPVITPSSTAFTEPKQVSITGPIGATIRYTTDGSTPTESSKVYRGPILVSFTQTVKAIAIRGGFPNSTSSSVATETFTLDSNQWPAPSSSDTTPLEIRLQLPINGIPQ